MCICVFAGEFSSSLCPQHAVSLHHIWASDPSEGPGQVSGGFPRALQCQRGPELHPGASFPQDYDALPGSRPTQRPAQDRRHRHFCLPVCSGMCLSVYPSLVETRNVWNEFICHCTSALLHTNTQCSCVLARPFSWTPLLMLFNRRDLKKKKKRQ